MRIVILIERLTEMPIELLTERTQNLQTHTIDFEGSLIKVSFGEISSSRSIELEVHMSRDIRITLRQQLAQ